MSWKERLRKLREIILFSSAKYRHGLPIVPVSSIAEQYYCEVKVDLKYKIGDVDTLEKRMGEELHNVLLPMEKTTWDKLIEDIESERTIVASFPLCSNVNDLIIGGRPDAVVFSKGKPIFLVELKTTKGSVDVVWKDEIVQVQLYALLLDLLGFDCSALDIVIVKLKRDRALTDLERDLFLKNIIRACFAGLTIKIKGKLAVHKISYSKDKALNYVQWASNYWLNMRDPVPTRNKRKCAVCEYKARCQYAN